jgi:hypothetical protein
VGFECVLHIEEMGAAMDAVWTKAECKGGLYSPDPVFRLLAGLGELESIYPILKSWVS